MGQVFISYSWKDNISDTYGGSKERYVEYHIKQIQKTFYETQGIDLNCIFFDRESMNIGDDLNQTIEKALDASQVMIAFITPGYFKSAYCRKEWKRFAEHQGSNKKIYPFIIRKVDDETFTGDLNSDEKIIYAQVFELVCCDLTDIDVNPEIREQVAIQLKSTCKEIARLIKEGGKQITSNTHTIDLPIDNLGELNKIKSLISLKPRFHTESEPVCVIYTGGSVGMIRDRNDGADGDDLVIAKNVRDIVSKLPGLQEIMTDIHFFSYENPIDSSNIGIDDWIKLSKIIEALYSEYDGFVILHGANTLAYTASALSFIFDNLNKPVIVTGSELPLVELGSDAGNNIIGAIKAASPNSKNGPVKISEVCVLYGNSLLRGNRTTKKHSLSITEGFYSPNIEPIGEYKGSKLNIHNLRKKTTNQSADLITHRGFDDKNVFVLELYPGINFSWFKNIFKDFPIKGLIIKSYTTGNVPEDAEFIDLLHTLLGLNVIIVNITQCPIGQVELRLFETNAKIFDMGVINGGDMTMEAAYCKLKYLIGKYGDYIKNGDAIKTEFQEDLRGEMSLSAYSLITSEREFIRRGDNFYSTPAKNLGGSFDYNQIDNAFIRLQGVKIRQILNNEEPRFSLFYNRPSIGELPSSQDMKYELANFKKIIGKNISFNKNIEVTHRLRKYYVENEKIMIQILSSEDISFSIESVKLIVYTRKN